MLDFGIFVRHVYGDLGQILERNPQIVSGARATEYSVAATMGGAASIVIILEETKSGTSGTFQTSIPKIALYD